MKIAGTNYSVLSLKATNSLLRTQKAIARSLERLASGQRVSSPRDDAHAYVQGVGLTAQIRGLTQANLGLNTGLGMVATAESAVSTQINIVQRMRELAVQAANGSLTNLQRSMLNEEVQTLLEEYNRITAQTDFNGKKLLDGSFTTINLQAGSNKGNTIGFTIGSPATLGTTTTEVSTTVGLGTFQARVTFSTGTSPSKAYASDLNNDGKMDIITDDAGGTVSIRLGNGNGTFQARTTLALAAAAAMPGDIITADLNNDGNQDILVAGYTMEDSISVYLGNGNGTFQTRTTVGAAVDPWGIVVEDLNGDGKQDLIYTNAGSTTVAVKLGNGNGTFAAGTTYTVGSNSWGARLADFNGDGKSDMLVNDSSNDTLSLLLGNGNGTFQARTTISTGDQPQWLEVGDINNDGKIDIVEADALDNTFSIRLGNGNGTFGARTTRASGNFPNDVRLEDLNGDGNLDLIGADRSGNSFGIYLGNGNGTFGARTTYTLGTTPFVAGTADFNGDGVLDIFSQAQGDNTISINLANTQTTLVSSSVTFSVATQEEAEAMLDLLDDALESLSETRADLSAIHSRLNTAVASNLLMSDNLVEARSKALDTDYATEVADLVRNQILQDAGLAVLAQANLNQQLILKLLE